MPEPKLPGETTALGLLRYALEYFAAAHAADRAIGDDRGHEIHAPMVVNFLIGQSIELALKAYLLSGGISIRDLKDFFRHDLLKLFDEARAKGFGSDEMQAGVRPMLWLLNKYYKSRELQYFQSGTKEAFPVFGPLNRAAVEILRAAMDYVPGAEHLRSRKAAQFLARFN